MASDITCFEFGWAHGSEKRSSRRYQEIGQIRVLLEEADVDRDAIEALMESVAKEGFGEIPEWWLLDRQANKLGISVLRP
jgi:hypothetical protein